MAMATVTAKVTATAMAKVMAMVTATATVTTMAMATATLTTVMAGGTEVVGGGGELKNRE